MVQSGMSPMARACRSGLVLYAPWRCREASRARSTPQMSSVKRAAWARSRTLVFQDAALIRMFFCRRATNWAASSLAPDWRGARCATGTLESLRGMAWAIARRAPSLPGTQQGPRQPRNEAPPQCAANTELLRIPDTQTAVFGLLADQLCAGAPFAWRMPGKLGAFVDRVSPSSRHQRPPKL